MATSGATIARAIVLLLQGVAGRGGRDRSAGRRPP